MDDNKNVVSGFLVLTGLIHFFLLIVFVVYELAHVMSVSLPTIGNLSRIEILFIVVYFFIVLLLKNMVDRNTQLQLPPKNKLKAWKFGVFLLLILLITFLTTD